MKGKHREHRFDNSQTEGFVVTFTWTVKRAQNNFVPIFNSKVGVRLIHECDLYSSKYGISS